MEGKRCFAVCPSDTAVALAALDASVLVEGQDGGRKIMVTDFFSPLTNALKPGEIVRDIEVPALFNSTDQRYTKFTLRKPIDFAIVSVAMVATIESGIFGDVRIALGGVAPGPVRARAAEAMLKGTKASEKIAFEAAEIAVSGARPLSMNSYKIEITKSLIKRALLGGY
jgi:xanthine dehydrogenase YagS FAD-binding subunit